MRPTRSPLRSTTSNWLAVYVDMGVSRTIALATLVVHAREDLGHIVAVPFDPRLAAVLLTLPSFKRLTADEVVVELREWVYPRSHGVT